MKILNKIHQTRHYRLTIDGLPGARIKVIGRNDGKPVFTVKADRLASFRVLISTTKSNLKGETTDIRLRILDQADGKLAENDTVFRGPKQ